MIENGSASKRKSSHEDISNTDEDELLSEKINSVSSAAGKRKHESTKSKASASGGANTSNSSVKGIWSSWEENGQCSTTCGNGTEIRRRRCDNTAPTNDGDECPCDNITYVHCNTKECPDTLKTVQLRHIYKWGHLKELNLTKDDLKEIMKEELNEMKSNLTIDSKNISATIRKHISARDDRPSAASVGYVGVALLLIPLMMIICFDASKFFATIARFLKKVGANNKC
ncbi:unnamed protein product [Mytilus edulis]|uniref:Uncharacterized protein n=1 Tax=Mytilus edulis TaxID=6550 RepID=A0A8S3RG69_MYTED|nr:unnamed protein product [Mytilus edulis]